MVYACSRHGHEELRAIEPLGLVVSTQGNLLLHATCLENGGHRSFRVDRISDVLIGADELNEMMEEEDADREERTAA